MLFALALAVAGLLVLAAALSGRIGSGSDLPAEPSLGPAASVPSPSAAQAASVVERAAAPGRAQRASADARTRRALHGSPRGGARADRSSRAAGATARRTAGAPSAVVAQPSAAQQGIDARRFVDQTQAHIAAGWVAGFYPIYASAQSTFGVNWLLLASIHRQESAFSTASGTYHGLNFAHCCGGPMQFNVTNGPITTWQLVSDAYRYGRRPRAYVHMTLRHPSIYDDFDSIMAAAWLLSADGARMALDAGAWVAAYDYYGHDLTGVTYADQVLARAIGWSQHGFCINCGVRTDLIEAVHAAYGAPVAQALTTATVARVRSRRSAASSR